MREGFLEEVHLDSEHILLREEGQRNIPIRRGRGKQEGRGEASWCAGNSVEPSGPGGGLQVRCGGPEVGEVGSRDAAYPHFILQRAGSLEVF